jgi:prolipoprotein diacylglyceryl transferase
MQQVLFRLPGLGLPIYGFGMMLFVAFLVCTWVAGRRAEREGMAKEIIQDFTIWIFIGGLLGGRVAYVLEQDEPASIGDFFSKLPQIWAGGLILYGSVVGAFLSYLLAYYLSFRKKGVSTLKLADIVAPSLCIGLCLGRLGCFLNGCCFGHVACADCPVYPVHFPLSAPARYTLVAAGYQTPAGFTIVEQRTVVDQPSIVLIGYVVGAAAYFIDWVEVDKVEPSSAADLAGLRPGDRIVAVNGQPLMRAANDKLANYLDHKWPRGEKKLTLTVLDPKTGETHDLTFEPKTLGLHPTQLYESISMFLLFLLVTAYYPFRTRDGQAMALVMICYAIHRHFNELLRDDPRPVGFESNSSFILLGAGVALVLWLWWRPAQYKSRWAAA